MYVLGKTTTSHGIKGELKIKNLSDYDRFYSGEEVFIDDERLIIKSVRSHKNFLLVSFYGYESINDIFKICSRAIVPVPIIPYFIFFIFCLYQFNLKT